MHTIDQQILKSLALRRNGVPIYVQVRQQFLGAISSGALPPGWRMPTMRQVAVTLKIDLNTVRHAYEDLQRMGVIQLRQGQGSFVSETPVAAPKPASGPLGDPDILARRVIAQAVEAGIDPQILAERLARLAASSADMSPDSPMTSKQESLS